MADIKKNEIYTIDITGMTHEAQGVGRVDGFTVFVDGALEGERVEVKIIKLAKSYAVGKLLNILTPSPNRIEPFCSSYRRCGGCNLQHLNYKAQLDFKTNLVQESLKRIGKLEDVVVHNTIGMDNSLAYRNKAQFPVGMSDNKPVIGFFAARSHEIIENDVCGIQHKSGDKIRSIIHDFIIKNGLSVYDEVQGKGLIRHVITRVGFRTGEAMVIIVINGKDIPLKQQLIDTIVSEVEKDSDLNKAVSVKSIYLNINTLNTNIILGDKNIKIYGSKTITDYIGKFKFNISPMSFYQVNPSQTEVLYNKALEFAGLTGNETVFDLYCGIGTISLFLSEGAGKVYGVEVVEDAVRDAEENAKINDVSNAKFIAGNAPEVVGDLYEKGVRANVVVIDPPRKGCDEALLKTLVDMAPERIVYVSCNPATLARDLGYICGNGFMVREVQPVDMFPYTGHVECCSLIVRKDK